MTNHPEKCSLGRGPGLVKPALQPLPLPGHQYPVAASMTQPPRSAAASTQQPSGSWLRPRLWPISWAMVAAAPRGSSEWSWEDAETVTAGCGPHPLHLSSRPGPGELTMLTPPELSGRHMPSMGARPTVLPRKARPLRVERGVTGWGQEWPPPSGDPRGDWGHPREQLHGVVWQLCPQPSMPLQEGPERGVRIRCDRALVLLGPHFQASQCHLNVQSPEDLREDGTGLKRGTKHTTVEVPLSSALFPSPRISKPAISC